MKKTANPRAARRRRRGRHHEKRFKMLETKPHQLASEAPVGEYLDDAIAPEPYRGAAVSSSREDEFIRLVREDLSLAAQCRRRGKHREKRLKMLEAEPHWLANDAPYGKYHVDAVALELFLRGAAASNHGEDGFVRLVLLRED